MPEVACDLRAMVLPMDNDVEEDLMQRRFERLPFGVAIFDQGVKARFPRVKQVEPRPVQGAKPFFPCFGVHVRPDRMPGRRVAPDACQPDFLSRDDVGNEFGQGVGGGEGCKVIKGGQHAAVGPQVIGEEAA